MLLMMAILQDDGLTFREVLANLPHDAGAFVVYALVALFAAFIWRGSRNRPAGDDPAASAGSAETGTSRAGAKTARR